MKFQSFTEFQKDCAEVNKEAERKVSILKEEYNEKIKEELLCFFNEKIKELFTLKGIDNLEFKLSNNNCYKKYTSHLGFEVIKINNNPKKIKKDTVKRYLDNFFDSYEIGEFIPKYLCFIPFEFKVTYLATKEENIIKIEKKEIK
jgi:hypothetical protein